MSLFDDENELIDGSIKEMVEPIVKECINGQVLNLQNQIIALNDEIRELRGRLYDLVNHKMVITGPPGMQIRKEPRMSWEEPIEIEYWTAPVYTTYSEPLPPDNDGAY
jgi:hypothetical protein